MATTLKLRTRVKAGRKIEVDTPDISEGTAVDLIITVPRRSASRLDSVENIIATLPPGPRSADTWEQIDELLRQERDLWDR